MHRLFAPNLKREHLYSLATMDPGGRLNLELADGISRASAADIGRLAVGKSAWRAAGLVSQSCLQASVQREEVFPKSGFPFVGKTNLVASGKWLRDSGGQLNRFVVFRLEECSHAFPFKSLYARAFDSSNESGQRTSSSAAPARSRKKPDRTELVERDSSMHLSGARATVRAGRKFPDLDRKYVSCSIDLGAAPSESSGEALEALAAHALGEPGSNDPIRPLELEDAEQRSKLDAMPRYLRVVVESLRLLPTFTSTVLTVGIEDGWTLSMGELSSEPDSTDIVVADPSRRVLAIRLDRNGRIALLTVVDANSLVFSLESVEHRDPFTVYQMAADQAHLLASREAQNSGSIGLAALMIIGAAVLGTRTK